MGSNEYAASKKHRGLGLLTRLPYNFVCASSGDRRGYRLVLRSVPSLNAAALHSKITRRFWEGFCGEWEIEVMLLILRADAFNCACTLSFQARGNFRMFRSFVLAEGSRPITTRDGGGWSTLEMLQAASNFYYKLDEHVGAHDQSDDEDE